MAKLIGYKKGTSKKGNDYCMATLLYELSERDKQNGAVGQKVEDIFLPENQINYLKPEHIGKEIVCDYEYSGGRGYLVGITVK